MDEGIIIRPDNGMFVQLKTANGKKRETLYVFNKGDKKISAALIPSGYTRNDTLVESASIYFFAMEDGTMFQSRIKVEDDTIIFYRD